MSPPSSPSTNPAPPNTDPQGSPSPPNFDASVPAPPIADETDWIRKSGFGEPVNDDDDDDENNDAHESRGESPPRRFPARWTSPTSGELAFLAGLPKPTAEIDQEAAGTSDADDAQIRARLLQTETPSSDDGGDATAPPTGQTFSAASRQWNSIMGGAYLCRRDTFAVGERWGRHVRVIDVGNIGEGDASRKKSL